MPPRVRILDKPITGDIGTALAQGLQGYIQGRQIRQQNQQSQFENQLKQAQIAKIMRETESLKEPVPQGFVRLPDGSVQKDPTQPSGIERALLPLFESMGNQGSGNLIPPAQTNGVPQGAVGVDAEGNYVDANGNPLGRAL